MSSPTTADMEGNFQVNGKAHESLQSGRPVIELLLGGESILIVTSLLPINSAPLAVVSASVGPGGGNSAVLGERDFRNRETAAELIKAGIARDRALFSFRLGDPVWNILLDLYVAERRGKRVSISSLGIAAAVPRSTAQRCIAALVREAKLVRYPDEGDARRYWIALSAESRTVLDSYFDGIRAGLDRTALADVGGQVISQRHLGSAPEMGPSSLGKEYAST